MKAHERRLIEVIYDVIYHSLSVGHNGYGIASSFLFYSMSLINVLRCSCMIFLLLRFH